MRITLSVIKADIGSIGGHIAPSERLLQTVRQTVQEEGRRLIIDSYVSHTGDDIAIVMTHTSGEGNEHVHKLAWDAFTRGTAVAKEQGLYGAGQDLLKDALLRDPERYVVESVWSRATGEQAVALATSRLHNIAGKLKKLGARFKVRGVATEPVRQAEILSA